MRSLTTDLEIVLEGIQAMGALLSAEDSSDAEQAWETFEARLAGEASSALGGLVRRLELGPFQLRCLLLALSYQLDPQLSGAVIDALSAGQGPTVGLATERFCLSLAERVVARRAFSPESPWLRQGLITLGPGEPSWLARRRIDVSAPALQMILGEEGLCEQSATVARIERPRVSHLDVIVPPAELTRIGELVSRHESYHEVLARWGFESVLPSSRALTVLLSGPPGTGKSMLAGALAHDTRRPLMTVRSSELPGDASFEALGRILLTEAVVRDAVLAFDDAEAIFGAGDSRGSWLLDRLDDIPGVVLLLTTTPERLAPHLRQRIVYEARLERPGVAARRQLWELHLPVEAPVADDIDLAALASRYELTGRDIRNAVRVATHGALAARGASRRLTMELLERAARSQLAVVSSELTIRSNNRLTLGNIVLPAAAATRVCELLAACRNQTTVLERWGFGDRLTTGRGITALFDGPPGTGKTYCAEVLAGELSRPLHRVNLAQLVSKWAGETEKHIQTIFRRARSTYAILLFDEADSLFSSRVRDTRSSQDKSANMEVNLLLQEIERFDGICILTTNFHGTLDDALARRIQFRVTFDEPDASERARIWKTLCPATAPLANDVDFGELAATYQLTGGAIKNALLRAAYRACDAGHPIGQVQLARACHDEYVAAGRVTRDLSVVASMSSVHPLNQRG